MKKGIAAWPLFVEFAFSFFSIPLLFGTLLSPLRREGNAGNMDLIESIAFFFLSRVIGFVLRVACITLGLIFTFFALLSLPIFFLPVSLNRDVLMRKGSFGMELSFSTTYFLDTHSRRLSFSYAQKLYGRDVVVSMIVRGLTRDGNNNVLLAGVPGVGKSTILGYLSQIASSGLAPKKIRYHRVIELMMEGISMDDLSRMLEEAKQAKNVILVIENIHLYTDASSILLPYLQSEDIAIIGTTDGHAAALNSEHTEFARMFEQVNLASASAEDTILILKDVIRAHGMHIDENAIQEIIRLTGRYMPNAPEPARSLDILEELRALGTQITLVDVQQIVSQKTNIPLGALSANETEVLQTLGERMRKKIIGQDEAVKDVTAAIRRLRAGIADPKKPAGSFLFLGPTGVGKTQTAKVLAENYFGHSNAMIRFDMSEFALEGSIEVLKQRIARAIELTPLSLVFFDELEKAHSSIHNLLLQVLDEGRLTENNGQTVNLKNAIIIATSNAGSADIIANPEISKTSLIALLIERGIYAPEFLNRFSSVVLFSPLDPKETRQIAELMLADVAARLLADKKIILQVQDAVMDQVAAVGFDPQFGARPIKRAIEELIENKVADAIIAGAGEGTLTIG
ncbi:MAG: AAA family ATPase [Candidatus Pacebacteria bacterium]|jgi:ATP-dependent Clp protease ATP-binding subunit ClpC|nr:AAA family ATPase [Candidatus Paceibacterota bacterium]